ncbi:MAG: hypothetical protein PHF86_05455 [Candidatus Nanoarchaeia archaeon]|nr:hypothetical protein [Candidatus Nanoarchaeia archaeon]
MTSFEEIIQKDKLEALLDKNIGKPILLVHDSVTTRSGHYGPHHNPNVRYLIDFVPQEKKRELYFGIIEGNKIEMSGLNIELPTTNIYLEKEYDHEGIFTQKRLNSLWRKKETKLTLDRFDLIKVKNILLNEKPERNYVNGNKISLFFDKNVAAYFINTNKTFKNEIDLSYVSAMNLLNQEIPKKYKKLFDSELKEKALELYLNIQSIRNERKILKKGIDNFPSDDEIFKVLSTSTDVDKISSLKSNMIYLLNEAECLGLFKIPFEMQIDAGTMVNLAEYFKGLKEQFGKV